MGHGHSPWCMPEPFQWDLRSYILKCKLNSLNMPSLHMCSNAYLLGVKACMHVSHVSQELQMQPS